MLPDMFHLEKRENYLSDVDVNWKLRQVLNTDALNVKKLQGTAFPNLLRYLKTCEYGKM